MGWISGLCRNWMLGLASGLSLTLGGVGLRAEFAVGVPSAKGVDPGELLLGELNCTACHTVEGGIAARLNPRGAPKLGAEGLRLEPGWIRQWLLSPSASKPGTGMPHVWGSVPEKERAGAADELVHYLVSIQPSGAPTFLAADRARVEMGRDLYHTVGCVACHAPTERPADMPVDVFERARREAVPVGDLASKYPGGELIRFLLDPIRHRPGGRMPSMGLGDAEARAIATFLLRDQAPGLTDASRPLATVPGVKWEYFEGPIGSTADLDDGRKPVATGESDDLSVEMKRRGDNFGVRFVGTLEAPADGEYSFWLNSDDGSSLELDGKKIVNNDGVHPPREVRGKVSLKKGPHTFDLRFFQGGGGYEFAVRWAGPGFERQTIPAGALKHHGQPMLPTGHVEFAVDGAKAAAGRARFAALNCAACHAVSDGAGAPAVRPAKPLLAIAGASDRGCLAEVPPAGVPRFDLSAAQRVALRRAVAKAADLARAADPGLRVALGTSQHGCLACHQRDGVGGPSATGREGWFKLVGEADLGEEGRIPPHLEKVGAKLRPEWMRRQVAEGLKVRPYMATRMPRFGEAIAAGLATGFEAADVRVNAASEPAVTEREAKYGRKLVGRDGLSCIACHTFAQHGSLGIPALGLDRMHERLRWDWFRRYLPDPAALRPGTRMPSFWPEGKAVNTEILGGNTEEQIRAVWAWLAAGAKADVPAGLVRSKQEIVVGQEALIYRNFIEGAGSRAIGVGYPEHAHLAFDANQLRLALLWQGGFIDMSRHSTDRGVGFEPPLGDHVVRLPEGPSFARLAAADAPWPRAGVRSDGQRFIGYTLDAVRRPTFRYRVAEGAVEVADTPIPKAVDVDIVLTRTIELKAVGAFDGTLWFRAAAGEISKQPDGSFLVDGKVRMRFPGADAGVYGRELRVPLKVPGRMVQEILW